MMNRLVGSETCISVSDIIQFRGRRFVDKECALNISLQYVPAPIPTLFLIIKSKVSKLHVLIDINVHRDSDIKRDSTWYELQSLTSFYEWCLGAAEV